MRRAIVAGTIVGLCGTAAVAGPDNDHLAKSLCFIEKAAGILFDERAKDHVPKAVRFEDKHNHFILSIKPIIRSEGQREWCLKTLEHWMPILAKQGTFDPDPGWSGKPYDLRHNIGRCFSSSEATIKFFDRDSEEKMESYDFQPMEFTGLAGNWIKKKGDRFEAGSTLDAGPVVFSGTCKSID